MVDRNGVELRVGDRVLLVQHAVASRLRFPPYRRIYLTVVGRACVGRILVRGKPGNAFAQIDPVEFESFEVELPVVAAVARRRENEVKYGRSKRR